MDKSLRARIAHVKRTYGLSPRDWETVFNMQGRRCASCRSDDPKSDHGWHVDHSHENGRVRGILCHHCNVAAGMLDDDPARVDELAAYLRRTAHWHARTEKQPSLAAKWDVLCCDAR